MQIIMFSIVTLINLSLILNTKPYLDRTMFRLEVFNDVVALVFSHLLMVFLNDLMPVEKQYKAAWTHVAILAAYFIVHISY
jgi:hypothetical protein